MLAKANYGRDLWWHPLRDSESASHNQLLPGARTGDRSQKVEQLQQPVISQFTAAGFALAQFALAYSLFLRSHERFKHGKERTRGFDLPG